MRELEINKQLIHYALFQGYTDAVDSDGYKTGEKTKSYSDPVALRINVSPARGNADREVFGIELAYSRTLTTDKLDCPIDVDTILWIGRDTTEPHNYVVHRIANSLNSITYAIRGVDVS